MYEAKSSLSLAFNKKGSPSEHYFKRYLTLLHFDKAHCVRFENLSNLQK